MKTNSLWQLLAMISVLLIGTSLISCGDDEPTIPQHTEQVNDNGGINNDNGDANNNGTDNGEDNAPERPSGDLSGEIDGRKYVDLGLPSATLWADCNVGSTKPEGYDLYFAWGETKGYSSYTDDGRSFVVSTYKWYNGSSYTKYCTKDREGIVDNKTELELLDDAAYVNWGRNWRMPSNLQFKELIDRNYTNSVWTTKNGVKGYLITSIVPGFENNSIFLPAAGRREIRETPGPGVTGCYWTCSLKASDSDAYHLFLRSDVISVSADMFRYHGYSVRPVRNF